MSVYNFKTKRYYNEYDFCKIVEKIKDKINKWEKSKARRGNKTAFSIKTKIKHPIDSG